MDNAAPVGSYSFDLAGIHRHRRLIGYWHPYNFISAILGWAWREHRRGYLGWAAWREHRRGESWATWWLNDRRDQVLSGLLRTNQDILSLNRLNRSDCLNLFCSESESFFRFHVRWLIPLLSGVDFPDYSILVNGDSAERAELQCWIIGVVGDKVFVALLLELMSRVAGQLDDMFTFIHLREANRAFANRFGAKSRIDRATKMPLRPVNERLATGLVRGSLSKRLRSDERKPAVVLKFVPADRVILEVVKAAELVRHEVEAENAVLELLVVVDVGTLVTAASYDGVE